MALTPADIRALRQDNPKARARDLAQAHGLPEAALVAAHIGHGALPVVADPAVLGPRLAALGEVMALTRNESCVHERKGRWAPFHPGAHAAMVLGAEIDLRIFPRHWVHAFAVTEGDKRSLQVFDAAGDAVHKVHLLAGSDVTAFEALADLETAPGPAFTPRRTEEPAREVPAAAEALRRDWAAMTDTHQFLEMVKRHGMNRLGANRQAGAPHARRLDRGAVQTALELAARAQVPVMVFVCNAGCIQIHSGLIGGVTPMGPWINVMDPRFNLHLRGDRIAEVWQVVKPTATGDAVSVEAFDAQGGLILQVFACRKDRPGDVWNRLVDALPAPRDLEVA